MLGVTIGSIFIAEADTEVANQMAQEAGASGPLGSNTVKVTLKTVRIPKNLCMVYLPTFG